ncbi:MAG: integrase core domain-containing protein [Thermoanaerobaculia bacterium]
MNVPRLFALARNLARFASLHLRLTTAVRAENLFLRRQLALYVERGVKPRRATNADRITLALLARVFPWRSALIAVSPATLIRWQRNLARLFWRAKCRIVGRPQLPAGLRALIRQMQGDNPLWGEERIANELLVKLGIRVSPRTVRKYLRGFPRRPRRAGDQRWSTFLKNHTRELVACDFVVSMTVSFRIVYALVVLEIGSRRILHVATTAHPTAEWTTQQLREALPAGGNCRYLLHDRDSIFSAALDDAVQRLGLSPLKSPPRAPKANAFCERVIGTLRRECLDHVIPLSEHHLRGIVREWVAHYNRGRPHSALGPSVPEPTPRIPAPLQPHRHALPAGSRVVSTPVLGGLHHEYALAA